MADFQKQLDEELEKRGLRDSKDTPPIKRAKFSFKTFIIGLVFSAFIISGLIGWAQLSSKTTQTNLQKRLPSKTAIVTIVESDVYHMGASQPTLSMPSDAPVIIHDTEATEDITEHSEENHAITAMIEDNSTPQADITPNTSPFKVYRKAFTKSSKPLLSIIVTDLGLSTKRTEAIIKNLPDGVSIALSPYSKNLDLLTAMAREAGHEAWLMLPMETKDYPLSDSGPLTLLTGARVEQNNDRMEQLTLNAQGHVGFIPNKDHVFKTEDSNINPAIKTLLKKGFAILDSNTSRRSFVSDLAYKNDYPYGQNNFWLDDDLSSIALNQRLRQMMELGEAKGSVTMMLRPYPASIKALQKFLNSAAAKKFQLAPASALLKNAG